MQAKLIVVGGTTKNKEILLRLPTVIGRGRSCNVQLPYALVSRKHCEVFEEDGHLWARDLGSLNGTFLDGKRIASAEVSSGSHLTIGSVTFRVEHDGAQATPPTAGQPPKLAMPAVATAPIPVAQPIRPLPAGSAPLASSPPPAAAVTTNFSAGSPIGGGDEPEDDVEVVDDVSDLLPPNVAQPTGKTAINAAQQAEPSPPPPHDEDDLAAFLRSLGDK